MNKQILTLLSAVPLVAAGLVLSPVSAQAADIGPFPSGSVFGDFVDIYGFSSVPGRRSGVTVRLVGGIPTFTFAPTSYQVDFANGAFEDFGGTTGTIKSFTVGPNPVDDFLTLDTGDTFDLTSVSFPTFTAIASPVPGAPLSTVVSFAVEGDFQAADGRILPGRGIFSATFVGLTEAQIIARASSAAGIRTPYSATFEAVPEPMTMLGVGTALGFGAFFKRKNAKKG